MKTYVLIVSRHFLSYHPKAGAETYFAEKILSGEKLHTLRGNYQYWSKIIAKVNAGEAVLSVRYWSGKPYKSTQVEITKFTKLGEQRFRINAFGYLDIDGKLLTLEKTTEIAKNDGLALQDFYDWFKFKKLLPNSQINGIIIHFTNFKY